MPSQADFDLHKLHVNDMGRDHCGGKNPLWFIVVVGILLFCLVVSCLIGFWHIAVRLRPFWEK